MTAAGSARPQSTESALPPLVLVSRSPRRAALLRQAGYVFTTCAPPFDDPADPSSQDPTASGPAGEQARALAQAKARSCLQLHDLRNRRALLIAADTIVVDADGRRIGQPTHRGEAAAMLNRLIGVEHQVVTGVCLLELTPDGPGREESWVEVTRVHIGPLPQHQLVAYLDSGRWAGKAGGYNLAELEGDWPFRIDGDPTTVIGLPMRRLREALDHWARDHEAARPTGLFAILSGEARGLGPSVVRAGLGLLTPGYRTVVELRNSVFDLGLRRVRRLPRPTISIGNITTGGTGKTPMTIALARWLIEAGHTPAVLLRGYRGTANSGSDEAAELAEALGGRAVVIANPDRHAAASEALRRGDEADLAVSVFLLDDGFQHRQVARDLDLVLIDATRPLGFGRLLPRGLLREPAGNLRRADAVIVSRADQIDAQELAGLDAMIRGFTGRPPIAHTAHDWSGYVTDAPDGRERPADALRGHTVMGVCGIANPQAFEATLRARAGRVVAVHAFPDHHRYTGADVRAIAAEARQRGVDLLVMTEKDHVKWRQIAVSPAEADRPVWRPRLTIRWLDGQDALDTLMDQRLARP